MKNFTLFEKCNRRIAKRVTLIAVLLAMCMPQLWADDPDRGFWTDDGAYVRFYRNNTYEYGCTVDGSGVDDYDLGNIDSDGGLYWTDLQAKTWYKDMFESVTFYWRVKGQDAGEGPDYSNYGLGWRHDFESGGHWHGYWDQASKSETCSTTGLAAGNYEVEFFWAAYGKDKNTYYLSNGGGNYHANFTLRRKITYHTDGSTAGSAPATNPEYFGGAATVRDNTGLLRRSDGYVFAGWATSSGASTVEYEPGTSSMSVTLTADLDLYPVWKKGSYFISLTGASTAGEKNTTDFIAGQDLTNTAVEVNGVTFSESYYKTSGSPSSIKQQYQNPKYFIVYDTKSTSTKIRVYVKNTETSSKTLYYYLAKEGSTSESDQSVSLAAGEAKVINIDVSNTNENYKGTRVIFCNNAYNKIFITQIIAIESGTTLPLPGEAGYELAFPGRVASHFKTINGIEVNGESSNLKWNYDVELRLQSGSSKYLKFTTPASPSQLLLTTKSGSGGYVCTDKSNPSTTGVYFDGSAKTHKINLSASTTYYIMGENSSNTCISKVAFTDAPTITYNSNEGSGSMSPSAGVVSSNSFTPPSGKTFINWNTKANGSGTPYSPGDYAYTDVKLYAQWGYALTYDKNTTDPVTNMPASPVGAKAGSMNLASEVPVRSGYIFVGWQVGGAGTIYQPGGSYTMPSSAVTMKAKWVAENMTITDARKSSSWGSDKTAGNEIISTNIKGTISGGTVVCSNSDGNLVGNGDYGLVFDNSNDQITITVTGKTFSEGSVIVLEGYSVNTKSVAVGFTASSNAFIQGNYTTTAAENQKFRRTYIVTSGDGIINTSSFTLERSTSNKVYLYSLQVGGCEEPSCSAPTSPSISGTTSYTAGNTINLTASATGTSGTTTYTWYKGENWAAASAEDPVQAESTSGATFTKASCVVGDAGTYWCNISNGTGCEVQVSKAITVSAAPTVGTFTPASGATVKSGTTVTVTGSTGSTVYYQWGTSSAPSASTVVSSGTAGTSGAATVTTSGIASSATYLYVVAKKDDVNSAVSSASYTIDDTAPTLSSSEPANSATNVNTSGTIVLTFSEAIASVDATKFTLTNATKGAVAKDGSDNKKVNIAYSGASNSTTVTLATDAGAVTDAVGNSSAALSISFTTKAAAPAASCITWEGTPSSWTSSAMTVDENLVLEAVGKDWDINSSSSKYAKVWVEDETEIKKTVIAIADHSVDKYLQGSFADESVIQSLTIGAANNNGTKGTNKKYVVLFSATEEFTNVLAYTTGKYAQEITSPSYMDDYNASNLEKAVVVPSGAKYFRIYRKVVKDWEIGDFTADKDYGDGATIRIFKIEACPEGSACTDPTIAWDNAPANGVAGGTMTASVTSNYPAGVTYRSSDETVASVDASTGVIRYLKAGSATITATVVGDGTTYCNLTPDPSVSQAITVTAVATGITVTPSTIDVQVGGTADLAAALTPAGAANETVTWTSEFSSNATVAIVGDNDKSARVTGVALRPTGTAFKIYAKTSRLTANSWYATVRVYKGVTYDASTNSGTCATASAKYYGDAALVLPAATRTDYTFNGWYTASTGGSKIGDAGDEYTPTANSTTLYAQFTKNVTTYAITYELNGGTHGTTHPATGTPSTAHELSAPTRSGYTFTGWSVSPVVSGAKWDETSSPDTDITDASTLAVNGTSSVYFKNLAAANGAVTITAHWTRDCETSGGGGGSTTTTLSWFDSGTPSSSSGTPKKPDTAGKYYYGYTNSAKTSAYAYTLTTSDGANVGQGDDAEWVNLKYGTSLNVYADNTTTGGTPATFSNVTAISIKIKNKKQVSTFSITIGGTAVATNVSLEDANESTFTEYSYSSLSNLSGKITISNTGSGNSEKHFYIDDISITTAGGGDPVVTPCYHVKYHANGAERGTVEDAARYEEDDLVTVKANGFTKAGENFLGWATNESRADAGTVDYDPDDEEKNSFTMGTADVNLYAVWGTAAPRVYSLTGSTYRCTSDDASTITLAGSETDVSYQLYKDGMADGVSVTGTGSSLTWSKTACGTYTVVATRSAVSSTMSGEVVLSDYPLVVTENLNGGTVAQGGAFTLSAKVSVHADNSASYTYEWFSNDAANYDDPTSLGDATAMAASTGTQEFEYNPSTASGGTTYYFCEFKSPCNTVVRTRVVSVKVTTATTTFTWDRDGAGDDFEDLPQGGKHTITVTSNSGVAPSLEVAGTDVELTDVEQNAETATTTATLVLGASAADVVLTAEVSANGEYAEKSEDKEVIVKECSAGSETVLLSAYLSAYNAFTKDGGSGTATISNPGSDTHVTCSEKNYYKMTNGSTYYTFTLGGTEKFQAGDRIIFDVASADQGNEKDFKIGLKASTSGSELHAVSTTLTTCEEVTFTIPVGSGLINGNTVIITRNSSENRVYGISIVRGGGSGSEADVASGIEWIIAPDPAITRSISNDPFTYAVRTTTPSMGTITYASSVESVATVDANGRVTIVGAGTTTISAQQEAIGCYVASNTLSYSLTVASCTGEKEPVITYDGTVICPGGSKTLTATNYEDGATFQWYKDDAEIDGADEATYNADEAGTYTVVAHKECYTESSNSVTLTKMSATVDVKTYADEFTIKSERPYNFRLFEIEDGATMEVQSRSGIDAENSVVELSGNTITISGTAPTIDATSNATVVIRISRTGCSDSYVDKTVTIHKIPATAKKAIAWIATKTTIKDKKEVAVKGVKDEVDADKSSDVDLYQELEKYYTVTARNCYWTASEAELVKEYSQYDLIVLTDYPNSQTAPSGNDKSKSYTNAIGLLKDHIPMLTFEAYVAQCPNWEIPSNPQNTSNTQNDITLLCNADEIFDTSGKFGAGSAISVSTVGSGQALQGFLPADAPFVFIGSITDDGTTYIACCERQVNPAARMMIFGLNANTMNNLTSDGKEMVRGFINYLMISDAARIPDCSVIFNGGAGVDQNWNTAANWEGGTLPGKYASVRIDKPCVVSGNYVAEAGYLKIHTSTNESTYPYTGKLTIASDGVMAIDGTITRVEDNRYTLHLLTRPEDLIIESKASGQGALIFDNDEGTTQARVEMYSIAHTEGGVNLWQYVAVPLNSASRWNMGDYAYLYNNASGGWSYYDEIYDAFAGVGVTRLESTPTTYTFEGSLASTATQKLNLYNRTNMIGNSWTAPIQIVNFEESDFGGATASIFIYETGHDPDGGAAHDGGNTAARASGYWYEIPVFGAGTLVKADGWNGMKVIPAMQAFEVKNTSGSAATFTMNYDRLVRTATNDMNEARRAPRRMNTSYGIPTMRLTLSDGEIRNDVYLISGEQFSEGFDNGWDGGYVGGKNCSQLYALSPIGNLSMSAQPEMEGTILGFAAGSKTEFTITFHYTGEEKLYLNDMEAHQSTLISSENEYLFTAESGEKGDRFVIGEQLFGAPGIATGVTDLDAEATEAQKIIYNDKLYIIRGGKVYSAEGQLVK